MVKETCSTWSWSLFMMVWEGLAWKKNTRGCIGRVNEVLSLLSLLFLCFLIFILNSTDEVWVFLTLQVLWYEVYGWDYSLSSPQIECIRNILSIRRGCFSVCYPPELCKICLNSNFDLLVSDVMLLIIIIIFINAVLVFVLLRIYIYLYCPGRVFDTKEAWEWNIYHK